ncbi:hypothetical protein AAG906_011990 [Vitis piasezkii]
MATGERNRSEEVWIEVGNEAYTSKLKDLSRFLVGRWDAEDEKGPDLRVVEIWADTQWSFCGKVRVAALRDALFLFEFSNRGDAQRVLQEGSRLLKGVRLSLDWWAPTMGCSRVEFQRDVSWVRIPRLPLQFWCMEFFRRVGDACGGFVDVDEETKKSRNRRGARILVKNNGKEVPGRLEVADEPVSKTSNAPSEQGEGGCDPRSKERVKEMHYGGGNPAAGVGDRVTGWEIRIPEDKAGKKDGGGLVSLQEVTGLVKETPDIAKGGAAEVIRKDKMKLFEKGRSIEAGKAGKDGPSSKRAELENQLGGPACSRMPSSHRAKSPFKKVVWAPSTHRAKSLLKRMGMGCFKKEGRRAGSTRPNRSKEVIKGSAHVSVLGLLSSAAGENKEELPTPRCTRDFSMQEAPALGQDRNAPPWKSYTSGMYPISTILGGVSGESSGPSSSSHSLPGMGDSMGISQSRQLEETIEDPLETELPLCMVLKDGRSFSLPGNEGAKGEVQTPHLQIIGVGEKENDKSPWINKKFLGFCKSVGVSIEGFEEDILRILKEIENRRCFIRKSNEKKRGTWSGSRKERELKKLVSTINYDGVAGRETEEGELGRQMTVVPYEA